MWSSLSRCRRRSGCGPRPPRAPPPPWSAAPPAPPPPRGRQPLPALVLDEGVAAGQRALGVVRGQRQREGLEALAAAGDHVGGGRLALKHEALAVEERCLLAQAARAAGAHLAQLLVQPRALTRDVLQRSAG